MTIFCIAESDGGTKWCPMVRHSEQGVGGSYNRPTNGGFNCIGAECMAWRWVQTHIYDNEGNLTILSGDTHGYCGLAGPEWRRS